MILRAATPADAAAILAIYGPYVTDSPVSFETAPPTLEEMASRIEAGGGLYPWLVAIDEAGVIQAYAYATAFRARLAYRFTVETSVYVAAGAQRQGLGRRLYEALLETLEGQGYTQAVAAITLPNPPSVALHEALGFERAGIYRDVGYKLGAWRSVGLWQRPLAAPQNPPAEPRLLAEVASP